MHIGFHTRAGLMEITLQQGEYHKLVGCETPTPSAGVTVKTLRLTIPLDEAAVLRRVLIDKLADAQVAYRKWRIDRLKDELEELQKEQDDIDLAALVEADRNGEAETDGEEPEGATDDPETGGT